jgi:hypothetical protein
LDISLLKQGFNYLKDIENVIMMIRHSEKNVHSKVGDDRNLPLSENGIIKAQKFGRNLSKLGIEVGLIKSSPFKRCVETAEEIIKGGKLELKIINSNILGDPGPFVIDDHLAMQSFLNYSVEEVVNRQIKGEDLPGMRNVKLGVDLVFQDILEDFNKNRGLCLYLTHDAILAAYVGCLTNIFFSKENWFDYLNGVFLFKKRESIYLLWNSNVFLISNE